MLADKTRLFAIGLLISCSSICLSQDQPAGQPSPEQLSQMMEEARRLVPEHDVLKLAVGTWDAEQRSFMGTPEPVVSKGTATFRLTMGGRFLLQNYRNKYDGKTFRGMGISGYDKTKKKYIATWMDNFGTGIMHMEGTYDKATKTMTEMGESEGPMGKVKFKLITKHSSKDKVEFSMYMIGPDGSESKTMEIVYTRKEKK